MARRTIKQRIALDGGKELKRELEQLGADGKKAFDLLQKAANDVKGPSSAFLKSLDVAQKKLGEVGKSFKRAGADIQAAGRAFTTRVTLPIAGAATAVVKLAGDFEAGMNRVGAASKATASELDAARELALRLGADTSFSAREAADGMEILVKNGLDMQQVLGGATEASLTLAAATGSELAGAADVATDVLQSFNKGVKDLKPAVDQITGTLLESKFGFDDYRLAIGQAGGVAGGLGVKFEDFNAVLAATSNLFSSGSDAGTSFKTFITRLVPQSDQAAAAIERFGLEFFDANGNMRSMGEIAEELRLKLGKLSERDLNAVLKEIFGTDALRTAIGLMRQGADGIENLRAAIARGNAEEQAAARMKGFNGALEELLGSLETLAIRIGDSGLLETITDMVKGLGEFVEELSKTSPDMLKFGTQLAAWVALIGPVIIGLGFLISSIGQIAIAVKVAIGGIALLSGALTVLAAHPVIAALTVIVGVLGFLATRQSAAEAATENHRKALSELDAAILQVKAGVPGAADELEVLAKKHREAAQAAIEDAKAQLEMRRIALDAVKQSADLSATGPLEKRLGTDIDPAQRRVEAAEKALDQSINRLTEIENKIKSASANATDAVTAPVKATGAAVDDARKKVDGLSKTITVHASEGGKLVQRTFTVVDGVAQAAAKSKDELDKVTKSAKEAADAVGEVADAVMVSVPEEMKGSVAAGLTEGLVDARDQVTTALAETGAAADEARVKADALGESWRASGETAARAFTGAAEQTRTAVDAVVAEVGRIQPAVQAAIGGGASSAEGEDQGAAVAAGIAESLARPFEDARARITAALAGLPEIVTAAVAGIQSVTVEFGAALGAALVTPFDTAATAIAQILERMVSVVKEQFDAMLAAVRSMTTQLRAAVAQLESLAARAEAAASRAAAANARASGRAQGGPVGNGGGGFAGGGRVSGPGTATSDSILSWLSDGEFVMRTKAVNKYGQGFMAALNDLRFPADILERLRGFAAGGYVDLSGAFSGVVRGLTDGMRMPSMVPAFADGGAVATGGGRPLALHIGGERFDVIAPEDVADRLAKHQSRQGLRQAGGRPGWRK